MPDAGTLCILREPPGYHVRYTSQNPQSPERQPARCPDAAALATLLQACGLDAWSRQQACTDLRKDALPSSPSSACRRSWTPSFPWCRPGPPGPSRPPRG
jgi:hypothetical protein